MSTTQANAAPTPTSEAVATPAPGLPPQDATQVGLGESISEIEMYRKDREAFLAEPETAATVEGELPPVPAVETAPVTETIPTDAPAEGEIEVGDPVATETPQPGKQYRFRPTDGAEKIAFELRKVADAKGEKLGLKEALIQAEALIERNAPAKPAVTQPVDGQLPADETAVNAQIADLKTKRAEARKNLDFDTDLALEEQIDALKEHKLTLRTNANNARAAESQRFTTEAAASQTKAVELYPDTAVAGSPQVMEMIRLDEILKATDLQAYHSASKPLQLARMAAFNLGIPPGPKPVAPTASPQPTKSRPVQPAFVAPGSARTSPPPTAENGRIEAKLKQATNVEQYEAAKAEYFATHK